MIGMRFDQNNLCPNCESGNHVLIDDLHEERCWGISFTESFICTNKELSGKSKIVSTGFLHWYENCACGKEHGPPTSIAKETLSNDDKKSIAIHIWDESSPIDNTNGESYLANRNITILSDQLRYHPQLQHQDTGEKKHGCLIAKVSDINNNLQAIQRIYIEGHNKKETNAKLFMASPVGGAVKFGKLDSGANKLGICEGIETALSVHQSLNIPVWASLSSEFIDKIILPTDIKELILFADGDSAGSNSIVKFTEQFGDRYTVTSCQAPPNTDYNDMLQEDSTGKNILLHMQSKTY